MKRLLLLLLAVSTLLAGCALWAWSLLTGRPAFRKWMIFGALSLSLLCLY